MPLPKTNSIRQNVAELMNPPQSKSRKRAIITIAKKNNITRDAAQFKQALKIATSYARKNQSK